MSGGGHAPGAGRRGATEFPLSWNRDQITERILDVARYPDETPRRLVNGLWHTVGVRIVVLLEPTGSVRTAFPADGPGVVRNPDATGHTASDRFDRVGGELDAADRELYEQLHRAGEWNELNALLTVHQTGS